MKRNISAVRAFGIGFAALTLLAALLRSLAFATAFDSVVGYFDANIFSTLLYIVIAMAVAGAIAHAVIIPRVSRTELRLIPDTAKGSALVRLGGLLVALAYAACAAYELMTVLAVGADVYTLLFLASSLLAIPYFLLPPTKVTAWFGLAAPAFCILSLITEYFDRYVPMNSPIKLMQQCTALAIVLFLLTEFNALAGNPQPKRALPLGYLAAFFAISNGVSSIVAALTDAAIPLHYVVRAVVMLALGLYVAARLAQTVTHPIQNDTTEEA